jgi:tol-pal system protein YbgF
MHLMFKRSFFVVALLMSAAWLPAHADDVSNRMDALEGQVRQLVGQIEELNYTVKQLQGQAVAAPKKTGALEQPVQQTQPAPLRKKAALQLPVPPQVSGQVASGGVETIEETPLPQVANQPAQDGSLYGSAETQVAGAAPAAKILGALDNKAAQPQDGGFQGQVIVPIGEGDQAAADNSAGGVQPVALQPETPDDLFLRSEKSLLQLQYANAETGFKEFLTKYPDHNLAGSAQFKLGETFYAQQNYTEAAQNYLAGYKQYPKSRRAADSLMKLGLSLNKMGQKTQGCAALGSVGDEFPNAVEAKKRAQTEFKRAGC